MSRLSALKGGATVAKSDPKPKDDMLWPEADIQSLLDQENSIDKEKAAEWKRRRKEDDLRLEQRWGQRR